MKKKIAVIAGGDSAEKTVSLKTAATVSYYLNLSKEYEAVNLRLDAEKWEVHTEDKILAVDKNDFSYSLNGKKQVFHAVFIAIHGTPGEDGKLQAYFDLIGLPYTGCSQLNSAVTFNKWYCNALLRQLGFNCSESYLLRENSYDLNEIQQIAENVGFPCFVKPNNGGSSFGISKVKSSLDFENAIKNAFEYSDEVMIEKLMKGREVTCGVFRKNNEITALPVTEIIPKGEFFDYKAKYEGDSEEVTPAQIPELQYEKVQQTARDIYSKMGLRGLIRIDFILQNEEVFIIEINTVPGLSKESIVPQQAKVAGIGLEELFTSLLDECIIRKGYQKK